MTVTVLMSTYNGEKYLRGQLESILSQKLPADFSLKIIVRDDGSSDGTLSILEEYKTAHGEIFSYYTGENLRPEKSFWHLTAHCPKSDYYAYSDQDDYWYEDKLFRALERLTVEPDKDIPLLYSSNVMVADAELNPVSKMDARPRYTDFARVLIYNVSTGCTVVYNDPAHDEFIKYDMNKNLTIMHDRIADLICSMFGKVIYDFEPSMLYRQHGNNVCGEQTVCIRSFFARVKRFLGGSNSIRSNRARMLYSLYADRLDDEKKNLLYALGNYKKDKRAKRELLKNKAFRSDVRSDNFFFKWLVRLKKL